MHINHTQVILIPYIETLQGSYLWYGDTSSESYTSNTYTLYWNIIYISYIETLYIRIFDTEIGIFIIYNKDQ